LSRWLKLGLCYQTTLDFMLFDPKWPGMEPLDVQPGGPFQRHILASIFADLQRPKSLDFPPSAICRREHLMASPWRKRHFAARCRLRRTKALWPGNFGWPRVLRACLEARGVLMKPPRFFGPVHGRCAESLESVDAVKAESLLEALQSQRPKERAGQ
jgi:hypothetical protein